MTEAAKVAHALEIDAIDVGYFFSTTLDKQRVLTDPERYGAEIAGGLPLPIANLFHLFGDDLHDRNLAGPINPQNLIDLKSALFFAKSAGAPSVFILPGMINPRQGRSAALAAATEALKPMVDAGQDIGVDVLIEPHLHGILNSPTLTQELIHAVPGLRLVLDPSNFVAMGYRQEEIDPLVDLAGHVHLRQARPGLIQTKMEEGIIDFPGFFGVLQDCGYDSWLSTEFEHEVGTSSQYDDVLSETVKMRDCFRSWINGF